MFGKTTISIAQINFFPLCVSKMGFSSNILKIILLNINQSTTIKKIIKQQDRNTLQIFTITNNDNNNEFTKVLSRTLEPHNNIKNKYSWLDNIIFIINKDGLQQRKC